MLNMKDRLHFKAKVSSISKSIQNIISLINERKKTSVDLNLKTELVLEEIFANICIHGKDISEIKTSIKYDPNKKCIYIFIYDDSSIRFDQSNLDNREKQQNKDIDDYDNKIPLGHGLTLINSFCNSHRYRNRKNTKGNINMVVICEQT